VFSILNLTSAIQDRCFYSSLSYEAVSTAVLI